MVVEVAGRNFQEDFEPILERQIHHLINYAQGIMHIGQRDIAWYRVGKAGGGEGLHAANTSGKIIHAKYHQDFGAIFDKVQIKIYTEEAKVEEGAGAGQGRLTPARRPHRGHDGRDHRHLLLLHALPVLCPQPRLRDRPERTGLCGAYNWLDCKASFEINPTGPTSPFRRAKSSTRTLGSSKGVNDFRLQGFAAEGCET